jgi:predicted Zn-dependent protease
LGSEGVAGFQDMGREALAQLDGRLQQPSRMPAERQAALRVLAHEIGHVEHRYGTRMLIEQGVINIGMGLALGDVSSLVSLGGTLLTGLAYQRAHESEADCFALALMARAGMPTAPMGELLRALSAKAGGDAASLPSWLGSHPPTPERVRRLAAGASGACVH